MRITVMGEDNVKLLEQLCTATGLDAPNLIVLLLRKYGKELEMWLGPPSPLSAVQNSFILPETKRPIELPTNPGEGLTPIDL